MSGHEDHSLIELGKAPINGESPCGIAVRYEPEFEQLEAELGKLESLSNESVDWPVVVRLGSDILQNKSKDLLVAAYLTQGLVKTEAYSGLAVGLTIIRDLIENYWDGMFPPMKRLRARATAMQWLAEKSGAFAAESAPAANEADAALAAEKLFREIDGLLVEKMDDNAPMLSDLGRSLKAHKQAIEYNQQQQANKEEKTAPEPAPTAQAQPAEKPAEAAMVPPPPAAKPKPRSAPASAEITQPESEADARKAAKQIQDIARKVSGFWLKSKPSDPRPYRLARITAWMLLDQPPPSNDGLTQINPLPPERRKKLALMYEQSQYAALLPELEQTLARMPFWLDGQRLVAAALKAMGPEFATARDTVMRETGHFLSRLPQMIDLKFSDGTPFADDQTKMWLSAEVLSSSGGADAGESAGNAEGAPWNMALAEAKTLAASGEMAKAMDLFSSGVAQSASLRDQFQWRCSLADLLLQTGDAEVAAPLLEDAIKQSERYQLRHWEPALATRAQQLLYQSYRKLHEKKPDQEGVQERLDHAYGELCRIDPVLALTAKGD